ncbi:MAG: alpha/beta hydrolase [Candidatus Thiodiazotropha sp.]
MNENLTILESDGERLFTVEHHPKDSAPTKAYIFVHPFAEEKLWSHRVYVTTARAFCEKGILVARFDFRGHGDSDGDYEDASLGRHIADVNTVIDHIKQSNPTINKIGLFGLRLGATIACLTALSREDIDELILWDPILDGDRYMQEILRSNLASQMAIKGKVEVTRDDLVEKMKSGEAVNIEGYYIKYDYFKELSSINLFEHEYPGNLSCCILQVVRNPKQPLNKQYQQFIEKFSNSPIIDKAHEEQFWKEIKSFYDKADNLLDRSLSWLESK